RAWDPTRPRPRGNGAVAPATPPIAFTARSHAESTARYERPRTSRLPPPTAFLVRPVVCSQTKSPSITLQRQKPRPPINFDTCQPSPKKRSEEPSFSFFSPSRPPKHADPGLVSTHWPPRVRRR